jgi:hypothetical protein
MKETARDFLGGLVFVYTTPFHLRFFSNVLWPTFYCLREIVGRTIPRTTERIWFRKKWNTQKKRT